MYALGINALNKLNFTRKFQIILITLLLPILYASVIIYQENNHKINLITYKINGIETVNSLKPLRIIAAKHRGTSAQWFSGNKQISTSIRSLEADMQQAFEDAKKSISHANYSQKSRDQLKQLQQSWQDLLFDRLQSQTASHSFNEHSLWVNQVDQLINSISRQSGLTLDQNLATYELMNITVFAIPKLQEALGQLRGIGAGVATKGSFDSNSFVSASTLYNTIEKNINTIKQEFDVLDSISATLIPDELKQVTSSIIKFQKVSNEKLIQPDKPIISGSDYFSLGTETIKHVTDLHMAINQIYQNTLEENKKQMINTMILSLGIFVLLFLSGSYLFVCLRITVGQNAKTTQKMAADLEAGTLNQEYYSDSQDELGNTISALKKSYSQLRGTVSQVRNYSGTLSHSSHELLSVSKEVNNLGEEQKNKVAIISTAATELAATAQEVSSHCENAAAKMLESKEQASLGAKHSHSSAEVIRTLAINVRNAGDEIEQLAQQAASISTVIDVIKAIAEQTNLLALNAAIEAARAGEQGRGFAVVADEVRTLATRTQESTNEIENTISSLQQVAEKAVQAMSTSCEQANESEAEASKTGEALSDIENSINHVSSLIEQVATAGMQQASAANEIAQNIIAVDDASSELVEKASSMSNIADEVGRDSTELDKQMQQFQV
ncbi:MAG: hypothetical protein JKX82_13360 [Oleispira sp.]|nr:hypothetical protein [Oleispira sp.]